MCPACPRVCGAASGRGAHTCVSLVQSTEGAQGVHAVRGLGLRHEECQLDEAQPVPPAGRPS